MPEHVLLSERRQQNEGAFTELEALFEKEVAASATPGLSLHQILGGPGEPITRNGITFYPVSPNLLVLDDLMESLSKMGAAGKRFRSIAEAMTFILHVDDPGSPNGRRLATLNEVGTSFGMADMELLVEILKEYAGITERETPEGN